MFYLTGGKERSFPFSTGATSFTTFSGDIFHLLRGHGPLDGYQPSYLGTLRSLLGADLEQIHQLLNLSRLGQSHHACMLQLITEILPLLNYVYHCRGAVNENPPHMDGLRGSKIIGQDPRT